MSIDETLTHGVQREEDPERALTTGVIAFALGLTTIPGGGVLSNSFQMWAFEIAREGNTAGGSPGPGTGCLPRHRPGHRRDRVGPRRCSIGPHPASATGKAGAITGVLAIVGGALWAVAMLRSDFY
ncbi:hypothetical protein [Nocardioides sp. B-3]|uniref:hypothetical protein n=1 Tax=Nocardioides sp. B-3 TaxID=2895565 RepID=UPI0021531C3D|nr:hypothetical protein [Nocardioides sp. B-3]UUZ61507.1 hypothetical protein LP418_13675 [Nocardioides sp. B-3]